MKDDKEFISKMKSFFLDDFYSEEDLKKSMSITELILHDQYGKKLLLEFNEVIKTKSYLQYKLTEEDAYHDRTCLIANLESVSKCIGNHLGLMTCFHVDLNDDLMIFKYDKN